MLAAQADTPRPTGAARRQESDSGRGCAPRARSCRCRGEVTAPRSRLPAKSPPSRTAFERASARFRSFFTFKTRAHGFPLFPPVQQQGPRPRPGPMSRQSARCFTLSIPFLRPDKKRTVPRAGHFDRNGFPSFLETIRQTPRRAPGENRLTRFTQLFTTSARPCQTPLIAPALLPARSEPANDKQN